MTQLDEAHFELHSANGKDFRNQSIEFIEAAPAAAAGQALENVAQRLVVHFGGA